MSERTTMKVSTIKITLQSDLCVGSGYSYAGVIDSDVVSDPYGFPYIPARRLKGCMKEAAEMISVVLGPDTIADLFGERGQQNPGRLMIGNARLANYQELTAAAGQPAFNQRYPKETILQQFSSVRAQTRINADGTAMDNSLRFIRVINQHSPLAGVDEKENLTFYAEVRYPEECENELAMIAQATRSIGMNRNRGLGSVSCELDTAGAQTLTAVAPVVGDDSSVVEIHYTITNEEPLMISIDSDNVSETYIPGRMILGALATNYLHTPGAQAEDTAFRALFLDGSTTQFLNAYITDGEGARCIPVPGYIRRLKKSKKLVNYEKVQDAPNDKTPNITSDRVTAYGVMDGNQPKALAGKYCTIREDHKIRIKETERQLTYHHRHRHGDEEVQLYSHLEVTEGQNFAGVIRTTAAYQELVISLLEQGLQIGKSRSAQYGKCVVTVQQAAAVTPNVFHAHTGEEILVSLSAPAVIAKDGCEVLDYQGVYDQIARDLHIDGKVGPSRRDPDGKNPFGMIDTRLIYGYQSVWNLRRTPVAAISESSVLVYHMEADAEIDCSQLIGERNLEGYGEIHVEHMTDMPYALEEDKGKAVNNEETIQVPSALQALTDRIDLQNRLADRMEEIRSDQVQRILKPLSPAALGRVTLMLREAREVSKDSKQQYDNYLERIRSIKTKSTQEQAERYAERCNPANLGDLQDYWSDIALEGLTCQKYHKKQDDKKRQQEGD